MARATSPGLRTQEDYEASVAAYRTCLASQPYQACEGQRHIMDAAAAVLASQNQPNTSIYIQGR
jgi:hypothetical protein